MNFNLSEEQTMIQDSIARFVTDNYALDQRNAIVAQEHGFSAQNWQQFAELGWLSIPFAEEHGGFGGGPVDCRIGAIDRVSEARLRRIVAFFPKPAQGPGGHFARDLAPGMPTEPIGHDEQDFALLGIVEPIEAVLVDSSDSADMG